MSVLEQAHRIAAALARQDFHAFFEYVGSDDEGRPFDQRSLDRLVWEFVEECHRAGAPAGVMVPLGFGKTTQFCYRAAWEIGRDPGVLASIVTDSLENSEIRVALVRQIVARPEYRRVFPEVCVLKGHDERGRFTVRRPGLSKDATCTAAAVLGGTGIRVDYLLLDDVVTPKNCLLEPASRRRVYDSLRMTWMSRPKLLSSKVVRVVWIQTAYHMADASALLRKDPESGWRFLVVRAEAPYEALCWERWERGVVVGTGKVESPFPPEVLEELARRMGPTAAARGLANRPVSGEECPFKEEHFKGPEPLAPNEYYHRVMFVDPAGDATKVKTGDPDWCAAVVLGRHRERPWEVIAAKRMRGSPSEQARFIARMAVQYRMGVVYQEAVKDEALVTVVQNTLREMGASVAVKPVKPTTNKEIRIMQSLEPALSADPQLLRVCGQRFPELRVEALSFPVGAHDDLLDALAGAFDRAPGRYGSSRIRDCDAPDEDDEDRSRRKKLDKLFDDHIPKGNGLRDW